MATSTARAEEAAPGVAEAPTVPAPVVTEQRPSSRWYGAPILIGDGVAYACLLAAAGSEFDSQGLNMACLPPGVLGYALVGPITHAVHGNWGRSALSLAARGVLPIVSLAAFANRNRGCAERGDCIDGAVAGLFVGMLAATVVDAALLARERSPAPQASFQLVPQAGVTRQHAFVGASGTF